jgi:hypothetical protein
MSSGREKREIEIKKSAKRILDKFAKALAGIRTEQSFVERKEDRREEGEGTEKDKDFQKIFFENAPSTKKDCILAERGKWK